MLECSRIDPLVTPYVDGELLHGEQQDLVEHITACPPCRAKVAAERAVRAFIQTRRPELSSSAPPGLKARCAALRSSHRGRALRLPVAGTAGHPGMLATWGRRMSPYALAATLVLAVGGALLYQATRSSATVMAAELALDHEKCFRLNRLLGTHHSPESVEASMSSWFDWQVQLPDTAGRRGVSLVGSRPCLYGVGKVAHIMYRHNGHPVSLFMLPREAREDQLVEVFGHKCRIWSQGGRTFVLVGRESAAEIEQMTELVRTTIR